MAAVILINLLCLAISGLLLVNDSVILARASKLDCSSATEFNLAIFKDVCKDLLGDQANLSQMERLDLIQNCGCGLMRHDVAWEAMYTHDVEVLYYATKRFLESQSVKEVASSQDDEDDSDESAETDSTKGDVTDADVRSTPMLQDDTNGLKYFWDKLDSIASNGFDRASEIGKQLKKYFAESYYDTQTFTRTFSVAKQSMKVSRQVSSTCTDLIKDMGEFLVYFDKLITLSDNARFVFRLTEYNPTFYKLFQVTKVCQLMKLSGQRL